MKVIDVRYLKEKNVPFPNAKAPHSNEHWIFAVSPFINGKIGMDKKPVGVTMNEFREYLQAELPSEVLNSIGTRSGRKTFRSHLATMNIWKMANTIARAIEEGFTYKHIFESPTHHGKLPSKTWIENEIKKKKNDDVKKAEILEPIKACFKEDKCPELEKEIQELKAEIVRLKKSVAAAIGLNYDN